LLHDRLVLANPGLENVIKLFEAPFIDRPT
jgi:hypothetical protein